MFEANLSSILISEGIRLNGVLIFFGTSVDAFGDWERLRFLVDLGADTAGAETGETAELEDEEDVEDEEVEGGELVLAIDLRGEVAFRVWLEAESAEECRPAEVVALEAGVAEEIFADWDESDLSASLLEELSELPELESDELEILFLVPLEVVSTVRVG